MAKLVDLKGKPLDEAPEQNLVLATLRGLLHEIESGEIDVTCVYVLVEVRDANDPAMVSRTSRDSGMTVADAVFRLEVEKAILLDMMIRGKE